MTKNKYYEMMLTCPRKYLVVPDTIQFLLSAAAYYGKECLKSMSSHYIFVFVTELLVNNVLHYILFAD